MQSQFCDHFNKRKCGGCSILHVPYPDQLAAKQHQIVGLVNAAVRQLPAAIKPDTKTIVQSIVSSPQPMGYRASAKFCLHEDRAGKTFIGLYQQGSKVVVDTTGCPANVQSANQLLQKMFSDRSLVPAKFVDHGDRSFQKNRLKFLTIRTSPSSDGGSTAFAVVISHTGVDRQALATWLQNAGLAGLCAYESRLVKPDGDSITGRFVTHLSGPDTFPYQLNGQVFNISPVSFFQANHSLAAELIKEATRFQNDGDVLLDLYGGFGAYSFAVAARFNEIKVVDGNPAAIAAANLHANETGVPHLKAFADTCENYLDRKLPPETADRVTHLIVNPSRTGLSPQVIKAMVPAVLPQLREVHYISCSPSTFARDALALLNQGFRLTSIVPFDMFPQTDHVELVAKFSVGRV